MELRGVLRAIPLDPSPNRSPELADYILRDLLKGDDSSAPGRFSQITHNRKNRVEDSVRDSLHIWNATE